jgi:hypothetical protein
MADLVIDDAALATLREALRAAVTAMDSVRKVINGIDPTPVGAKPLVDAGDQFAQARTSDVSELGTNFGELADAAAQVRHTMGEVDTALGGRAMAAE